MRCGSADFPDSVLLRVYRGEGCLWVTVDGRFVLRRRKEGGVEEHGQGDKETRFRTVRLGFAPFFFSPEVSEFRGWKSEDVRGLQIKSVWPSLLDDGRHGSGALIVVIQFAMTTEI